jgi:hypothetical protein
VSIINSVKASRAQYRPLGKCGLLVSNPILGGMQIGSSRWYDWVLDEKEAITLLKAAYDRGINTVYVLLWNRYQVANIQMLFCERVVGYSKCIFEWRVRANHWQNA